MRTILRLLLLALVCTEVVSAATVTWKGGTELKLDRPLAGTDPSGLQ